MSDNPTTTVQNNITRIIPSQDPSISSESDSSELDEDKEGLNLINEDALIKFQKKKPRKTTAPQNMPVDDIPPEAKKVILLLKQSKDLAEYMKQVSLWSYILVF